MFDLPPVAIQPSSRCKIIAWKLLSKRDLSDNPFARGKSASVTDG
jgi:hypothetical protein